MKKLILVGLVVALVGCGSEPEGESEVEPKQVTFTTPVANEQVESAKSVDYMAINPQDIKNYINELDAEVSRVKNINLDDLKSVAQQSRRMVALRDSGDAYGKTVFDEPYGRCYAVGIDALDYWHQWHGGDKKFANDALKRYKDDKKACLEAVEKVESGEYQKAVDSVEKVAMTEDRKPPREGCLVVYDVIDGEAKPAYFTCPKQ